jgi:hypothetical protein
MFLSARETSPEATATPHIPAMHVLVLSLNATEGK